MPVRLDQLPRETQQQVLAQLEEQGQLVLDDPGPPHILEHARYSLPLRTAGTVLGYTALAVGIFFLAFRQPSVGQGYPEFFARVVAYVAKELWAIVRENAVPLSGNVMIAIIFMLGVFQAIKLASWVVRRFWPVLIVLSTVGAVAIFRLSMA